MSVCVRQSRETVSSLALIHGLGYWLFMPRSHCFPLTGALHKSRCDGAAAPLQRLVRRGGPLRAPARAPSHHRQHLWSAAQPPRRPVEPPDLLARCSFLRSCSFTWNTCACSDGAAFICRNTGGSLVSRSSPSPFKVQDQRPLVHSQGHES